MGKMLLLYALLLCPQLMFYRGYCHFVHTQCDTLLTIMFCQSIVNGNGKAMAVKVGVETYGVILQNFKVM